LTGQPDRPNLSAKKKFSIPAILIADFGQDISGRIKETVPHERS
jgi:hypothetical protein